MAILGFVEWRGQDVAAALAGCAAIGVAGLVGRALGDRHAGAPVLRPVRVRARRR
jgi:hypothetical protein